MNKGTAFTDKERQIYQLDGLLPSKVETIEEQGIRVRARLETLEDAYDKHRYLMSLYSSNRTLFFHVIDQQVKELLPVIYTPTIAEAVRRFSSDFLESSEAVYLPVNEPEKMADRLKQGADRLSGVKLMVITDGEGVLGIGDWGINGAAIAIGKLAVYTAAAGLDPSSVLPVVIDAGTANATLLDSPDYLGLKQKRLTGEKYLEFIDQFVTTASDLFPNVLFHWEDFGLRHAETILQKYRDKICTFNDDIQGTGIMIVAALNSVVSVTQKPLKDQTIMIFGAGTAGVGIADTITSDLMHKGLSEAEARAHIYLFDRHGLIHSDYPELTSGQKRYTLSGDSLDTLPEDLSEAVAMIQPTVLVGSSGQTGAFTEEVIRTMADHTDRPAVFPISNPSELAEAKAEDIIKWTGGQGLVVTGSPTDPFDYDGHTFTIGQANNALLYPGLGHGLITSQAEKVSDGVLLAAAHSINDMLDLSQHGSALLPDVTLLKAVSKTVSTAVVEQVVREQLNTRSVTDAEKIVVENNWVPEYDDLRD